MIEHPCAGLGPIGPTGFNSGHYLGIKDPQTLAVSITLVGSYKIKDNFFLRGGQLIHWGMCLCVCIYIYVCMYVCMWVRMYVQIDRLDR